VKHGEPDGVAATFTCKASDWEASGTVSRGPRGLVISALEVRPEATSTSGVTGALLRKIQVGEVLHVVRAAVAQATQARERALADVPPEPASLTSGTRRGGRAALSDDLLRQVAISYLAETAPDKPAGAVARMAEEYHRPEETIRSWIARARRSGWLGPSVRGRAGAEPGKRLVDLSLDELERLYPNVIERTQVRRTSNNNQEEEGGEG
jgi:hypothetical protein